MKRKFGELLIYVFGFLFVMLILGIGYYLNDIIENLDDIFNLPLTFTFIYPLLYLFSIIIVLPTYFILTIIYIYKKFNIKFPILRALFCLFVFVSCSLLDLFLNGHDIDSLLYGISFYFNFLPYLIGYLEVCIALFVLQIIALVNRSTLNID